MFSCYSFFKMSKSWGLHWPEGYCTTPLYRRTEVTNLALFIQKFCRTFNDIQTFSQRANLRVAAHLLSFSEGYPFWKCYARIEYQVSMKNKFKYEVLLPKFVKKWKKLLWSMYWGLHSHQMLSGKSKNYAISLLCNITQIWCFLSVSTRNIHLAVIWVRIWGLHKKTYSRAILRITLLECYSNDCNDNSCMTYRNLIVVWPMLFISTWHDII